ncbi:MAG TPA: MATE family efflux transporter [Vicinamibacterales bacterium]|nr:MATE family efflux transporter [Vicinamibacterales bacterium]
MSSSPPPPASPAESSPALPSAIASPAPAAASSARARKLDRSIVEGPITRAVWKLAWPTVLQNAIGGLQGIIDHAMVGHFVGFTGNAAIGVSWQIFLVVIVFISSLFTGMGVLVARFAGANEPEKVDRTVYQAFLTALVLALGIMAPIGYVLSPHLLELVNATPEVKAEAMPFLRTMFLFSVGMLLFFMLGGALRSAGDARTPLRLGIWMTILNITFNVVLIPGLGPVPALGTHGAAIGTVSASLIVSSAALWMILTGRLVIHFPRSMSFAPDWGIIRSLFRFGLPAGLQGVAMNIAGVLLLRFIGSLEHSAEAQAAYAVGYAELFSLITWTSVGLMGAAAAVAGQNLGAGHPDRAIRGVQIASRLGLAVAATIGALFLLIPGPLLGIFGLNDPVVVAVGTELLRYLSVSGFFITVALTYTGGLQGTGDTRSPLFITLVSQVVVPLGLCFTFQRLGTLEPGDVWTAILAGHFTRCVLSVLRFRQGRWRQIVVE